MTLTHMCIYNYYVVKRKHDEDEDIARATSSVSVNPAKISTGMC